MADRKQLKIADRADIADGDPFAELTRIMGFDPREPVAREVAADADDAFDIDLEKELMGEFDGFSEVAANDSVAVDQPQAALVEPPVDLDEASIAIEPAAAREADDTHFFSSLEKTFRFDDPGASGSPSSASVTHEQPAPTLAAQRTEDVAPALVADEPAAPVSDLATSHDDDFDAFFAEAVGQEFEPVAAESVEPEAEVAMAETAEVAVAEPMPTIAAAQPDEIEAFGIDDHDLGFDTLDHHETAVSPPASALDAHDDEFDMHFDQAMAGFGADAVEPTVAENGAPPLAGVGSADEAVAPTIALPPVAAITALPAEPVALADSEEHLADELDIGFDEAFADMAVEPEQSAAPAPAAADMQAFAASGAAAPIAGSTPTPAAVASPEVAPPLRNSTLEDELNALLGRMKARPAVAAPSSGERWRSLATPVAPAPQRMEAAAAEPPRSPAPTPAALQSRGFEWTRSSVPIQPKPVAAEEELDAAIMAGLADLDGSSAGEPADHDADFDFDDHAFDAAFAAEMKQAHAVSSAAVVPGRPIADRQEWTTSAKAPALPQHDVTFASPQATGWQTSAYAPAPAAREVPAIETVDVPERVVALADDLDIPDLSFDDESAEGPGFDDLDTEFASLLNDMNAVGIAGATTSPRNVSYDDDGYAGYAAAAAASAPMPAQAGFASAPAGTPGAFAHDDMAAARPVEDDPFGGQFDYGQHESTAISEAAFVARRPRRKGLFFMGIIGAIAVAGGLGALAFSFGGKSHGDAPVIVKADNQPIKVKPENPGGTVIPNQDNKVYDAVAKSAQPVDPTQQKLVTTAEEPVNVNAGQPDRVIDMNGGGDKAGMLAQADDAVPTGKAEDRIQPTGQDSAAASGADTPVVTPRKVRTMTVKADGSLVPADEPAAKVAATEPADPEPQHVSSTTDTTGAVTNAAQAPALAPIAGADADKAALKTMSTPARAPVAPQRPSDQPVNIVGEVKPDQVSSIPTTNSINAAGSWAMQIASQPTAESAQSTYKDLSRRYAGVLDGRGVAIVKAEIAGKGTFYRVRVPAQSRNDAVNLCTAYKTAGGNCFVSK